ncbi:MAG: T9SS type A sorting domain-containing protein [Bacteroidia bacterium]|jgi:Secretion system C-terminal sorting domain|nr:T9SS type A sorting domain-containing protein [Bacteroidia bacterium]
MKKILFSFLITLSACAFSQTTFSLIGISYPTCYGVCDGSAVFTPTTAISGPFTAVLSNSSSCPNTTVQSSIGNTITIGGLCPCVSDYSVNFYNSSMVLVGFELLQIPITSTIALVMQTPTTNSAVCSSCCDGSVYVAFSGGYLPPPNSATVTLDGSNVGANYFPIPTVCVGPHTVCVTDLANCVVCNSFSMGFAPNVGINELNSDRTFSFFPNPTTDKLDLMFTGNNIPEEIRFLDINGKLSYSQKTSSPRGQTIEINISSLPKGVYVAEIVSSMGLFRQKLIKLE